jgi:hypothetical protein
MAEKNESNTPIEEVLLKDIQPNLIVSKLSFNNNKCPLFISQNGNATALYRYSNSGPFIELSDPFSNNLIPALKYSIIQGNFCIFNFALIDNIDQIFNMLKLFEKHASQIHTDLYNHIINNSLMKQSFDTFMSLIPFDPIYEMVPEIYRNSKSTFRLLFFVQIEDQSIEIPHSLQSIFNCIRVKP